MAMTSKGNKNSASEDDLGLLHSIVTRLMTAKLKKWEEMLSHGADADLVVDFKQLNNVIAFLDKNGIVAADPTASEESELAKQVEAIKQKQLGRVQGNNVISFKPEEEEYDYQ